MLGHSSFEQDRQLLLTALGEHLVEIDRIHHDLAHFDWLSFRVLELIRLIKAITQIKNGELDHACAVFYRLKQIYYFREASHFLKQGAHDLVDALERVEQLVGYTLVS